MCKVYDNYHCHDKPSDRKLGWRVDDVIPGRDGPENLRILKKSQLKGEIGPWRHIVEFQPLRYRLGFGPLKNVVGIFGSLLAEILNVPGCTARQHSMFNIGF